MGRGWPWAYMQSGKLGDFVPKTPIGARTGYEPWAHMIKHYGSYDAAKRMFYMSLYSANAGDYDAHVHDWRLLGCRSYGDGFRTLSESMKMASINFAELEKRTLAYLDKMRSRGITFDLEKGKKLRKVLEDDN